MRLSVDEIGVDDLVFLGDALDMFEAKCQQLAALLLSYHPWSIRPQPAAACAALLHMQAPADASSDVYLFLQAVCATGTAVGASNLHSTDAAQHHPGEGFQRGQRSLEPSQT
mmetsp:Transcript_26520/g.84087  ORF Transcript_26520/g.84087 Transcript_26520/m.84087 type:complete len:112 (+) Transcript_26520:1584-1919(+)